MVNSLGIILESSYSRVDEFVRLKEELEILGHYFTIQKIRYQDMIASFYSLCLYLSIGGMVLSLIIAGIKLAANDTNQGKHQFIDVVGTKVIVFFCISCFVGLINLFLGMLQN